MPDPFSGGLIFEPPLADFDREVARSPVIVLCGGNNSGKSLVLKWLKKTMGRTAYMMATNRFYHVYHITTALRNPRELESFEGQFQANMLSQEYNYELNFMDLNNIIVGLPDVKRETLFALCGSLIGSTISLRRVQPDNELSVRYIDVDGQNLSVASTGTRLLMTLLGICMDERFESLLIDEPELGLAPRVQSALASFLQDQGERARLFPHLQRVILATHSHLFLNRADMASNFVVSKVGSVIRLTRVESVRELHRLQFNLLGNSLEHLFLPAAVVYVEGETDQLYLEPIISHRFPGRNIVVVRSGGDPKQKLHALREALGDLQKSPLRDRLFVVVDSRHARGLQEDLAQIGLPRDNFVAWTKNGIEYYYPAQLMQTVFGCGEADLANLAIQDDVITLNGINMRKTELCRAIVLGLRADTPLPAELEGLLEKMAKAIG